ncbi:MAG: ArsC family reductase, partial [Pseudohongiellaceae bacterium]
MITLYGIANCDTVKKARRWLDQHGLEYRFHDYKKLGIDSDTLHSWCKQFGYEQVLNRRGTTWRKLPDSDKQNLDQDRAIRIMLAHTSAIRRPILESG